MKKSLYFIVFVLMMPLLQAALSPIVVEAADRKPALQKSVDLDGCRLTLLKNREYFHALSEKIRDARTQIVMAFFLFKTNGHHSWDDYIEA